MNLEKSQSKLVGKEGYRDFLTNVLSNFVRIKSISSEESCREECRKAAKFLKNVFSKFGAETKIVPGAPGKNPLVIAKFMPSSSAYRASEDQPGGVLFYGHYDVQPANAKDWSSKPFEVTGIDGYLHGRGTSDNKGPIITFCFAVARLKQSGRLLRPVYFIIEGEEESGSEGLEDAVKAKLNFFGEIEHILVR